MNHRVYPPGSKRAVEMGCLCRPETLFVTFGCPIHDWSFCSCQYDRELERYAQDRACKADPVDCRGRRRG